MYVIVTIDGVTGGLAWKGGSYASVVGPDMRELGLWERTDVSNTIAIYRPPGAQGLTQFAREQTWGGTWGCAVGGAPRTVWAVSPCS